MVFHLGDELLDFSVAHNYEEGKFRSIFGLGLMLWFQEDQRAAPHFPGGNLQAGKLENQLRQRHLRSPRLFKYTLDLLGNRFQNFRRARGGDGAGEDPTMAIQGQTA
jgi:hypothetical protein